MKVLVTDANIFIDLILLDLLPVLFALGYEIHTTYAVLEELNDAQRGQIENSRLPVLLIKRKIEDWT